MSRRYIKKSENDRQNFGVETKNVVTKIQSRSTLFFNSSFILYYYYIFYYDDVGENPYIGVAFLSISLKSDTIFLQLKKYCSKNKKK